MTKVLIIDDDPDFQEFVCALFEVEGYEPHAAFDGETGLELYEQVQPDIVLLDVMMPGLDGYETCRRLRELGDPETPIIFISAKAGADDVDQSVQAGADDYVAKPFDFEALVTAVHRHVGPPGGV